MLGLAPSDHRARDRHRLGRHGHPCRGQPRLPGDRRSPSRSEQLRAGRSERVARGRARGTRSRSSLRDYRRAAKAGSTEIVSIEMFEAVGEDYWPDLLRHLRPAAGAGRADGAADDHHARRPLPGVAPQFVRLDPQVHLPGRPDPVGSRRSTPPWPRPARTAGACGPPRSADHYARTLRSWRRPVHWRRLRRGARRSASTTRSGACGSSTWPTARRGSASAALGDEQLLAGAAVNLARHAASGSPERPSGIGAALAAELRRARSHASRSAPDRAEQLQAAGVRSRPPGWPPAPLDVTDRDGGAWPRPRRIEDELGGRSTIVDPGRGVRARQDGRDRLEFDADV